MVVVGVALSLPGCGGVPTDAVAPAPIETADTGVESSFSITAEALPGAGSVPLAVTLRAGGSPGACTWLVSDGTALSGCEVAWTALAAGKFTAALTVVGSTGEVATTEAVITVASESCPVAGVPVTLGSTTTSELYEASGLVEGRVNPRILWTHNDNPDAARLFALDATGAVRGIWTAPVEADDLEDLAIGPAPGGGAWLYLGDIGDNDRERTEIIVFIVEEPVVPEGTLDGELVPVATVTMRYPALPQNSETLLVDPVSGDLYVVTKNISGLAEVFRKSAPHADGDDVGLELVATLDFASPPLSGATPTAGDISPLGNQILIRTYRQTAYIWLRDGPQTVADALTGVPCPVVLADEPQSESAGYAADGTGIWTLSERALQPVYFTPLGLP